MEDWTVGFVGTGVMGKSMAGHLLKAGCSLRVFTRTRAKADELVERGAVWVGSPAEVAAEADVVITMVGEPGDVEQCYLAESGVLSTLRRGALAIDMTTSSPRLAVRIAEEGRVRGVDCLDAPVSGGDVGARNSTLSIMVGGGEEAFVRALPLLQRLGKSIVRQGGAGAGQHTKMCNQIANAGNMLGLAEALAYARASGLDSALVLESISSGAAGSWALSNLAPRVLQGDYAPGFFVKHFIKDMRIALESAREMESELPGLELAKQLYERVAATGGEEDGTQALARLYFDSLGERSD